MNVQKCRWLVFGKLYMFKMHPIFPWRECAWPPPKFKISCPCCSLLWNPVIFLHIIYIIYKILCFNYQGLYFFHVCICYPNLLDVKICSIRSPVFTQCLAQCKAWVLNLCYLNVLSHDGTWTEFIFLRWVRILLRSGRFLCIILISSSGYAINMRFYNPKLVLSFSVVRINSVSIYSSLFFIQNLSPFLFCSSCFPYFPCNRSQISFQKEAGKKR